MGDNKVDYKRMVDISEAVAYLEALTRSLQEGRIVVQHGEKALELCPPSVVALEIEAKQKKDKNKFGFEIAWKNSTGQESGAPLNILSDADAGPDGSPPEA